MSSFGFERQKRLRTKLDFKLVFKLSKRSGSSHFTILARANEQEQARLGVVVAKRFLRRAVDRVLARRLIREYFRLHQSSLIGFDWIVLVRSALVKEARSSFVKKLGKQWNAFQP